MNMNIDTEDGMLNAVEWTKDFLSLINEGGIWAVPRSNALYQIYSRQEFVIRLSPGYDAPTERVLRELGFNILQKVEDVA